MTEYEPYGVRHFLREADAEGVSELRRRSVPLRSGETVEKGGCADTDELELDGAARLPDARPAPLAGCRAGRRRPTSWSVAGATTRSGSGRAAALPEPSRAPAGSASASTPPGRRRAAPALRARSRRASPRGRPARDALARERPTGDSRGARPATVVVERPGEYEIWLAGSVRGEVEADRSTARRSAPCATCSTTQGQFVRARHAPSSAGAGTVRVERARRRPAPGQRRPAATAGAGPADGDRGRGRGGRAPSGVPSASASAAAAGTGSRRVAEPAPEPPEALRYPRPACPSSS